MKILHVIRGLANSSGTTHIVGPLAEQQARLGFSVSVYSVEKGMEPPVIADSKMVYSRCFSMTLPMDNPGVSAGLAKHLRQHIRDFDVLHIHAIWNFPSWWAMRAARKAGIPYIVAPQGSLDPWALNQNALGKRLYGALTEIPLLRTANCLQALTEKEREQFRKFGLTNRTEVIPNGIDVGLLERARRPDPSYFGLSEECTTLLFLSRIHPKKGLDLLIKAMKAIATRVPELRVVVAGGDNGSGYLEAIKNLCTEAGLERVFVFVGEVREENKLRTFAAADAFILPSRSEGLPIAALEAMALGLPLIISDECNIPEVAQERGGYVVPPKSAAIVDALVNFHSLSKREQLSMGDRARSLARSEYTWDRIAEKTLTCYESIITGTGYL